MWSYLLTHCPATSLGPFLPLPLSLRDACKLGRVFYPMGEKQLGDAQ